MKNLMLAISIFITAISAHAVKYEESDLIGRLVVIDQVTGLIQGTINISNAKGKFGNTVAKMNMMINGVSISDECSGRFDTEDQTITMVCGDKNQKVLAIKVKNDKTNLVSYIQGSFGSAEFIYGDRPMSANTAVNVEIKNLDLR